MCSVRPTASGETRTRTLVGLALFRGHRLGPAAALALLTAAIQGIGPRTIPVPALFSVVEVHTTIAVVCALGFALAITQPTFEPAPSIAATSARGWRLPRLVRLLATIVVAAVLVVLSAPPGASLVALGATLVLAAEGLLSARVLGSGLAWALPLAHLLAAMVFGSNGLGEVQPWAWFIDRETSPGEFVTAVGLTVAALLFWASADPQAPVDRS